MEDYKYTNNPSLGYRKELTQEEIKALGLKVRPASTENRPLPQQMDQFDLDQEIAEMKALIGTSPAKKQSRNQSAHNKTRTMREQSTSGKASKNFRQKTNVDKKWQRTAIAVGIVVSMAAGGLLTTPIENAIDYVSNASKLNSMTADFQKDITNKYTSTTFTRDQSIDFAQIAKDMETDGRISNEELLVAVDTLGEVNTNRILEQASNPPAPTVEDYMRNHNITTTDDWKDKTIKAMGLEEDISTAQKELDAMFGNKNASNNTITYDNTDTSSYGGK